jgi:uncharacterized protein YndB with AHSA1/START domain
MPGFTVTQQINAPVEKVWEVLDNFGDIATWSPGVKSSALTCDGPVAEGTTRHCAFAPMGAVHERIETYVPNERMTVNLFETFKLPISGAIADFHLDADNDGTKLTIDYNYTLNRMGRVAKGMTDKQMRKGMNGLAADLQRESERITSTSP